VIGARERWRTGDTVAVIVGAVLLLAAALGPLKSTLADPATRGPTQSLDMEGLE
jgi:hypothetical protein